MSDEETEGKEISLAGIIEANLRGYNDHFGWRHKPTKELDAANDILTGANIAFKDLVSRPEGQDPPDCEALVNGELVGIEVVELVHKEAMERSLWEQGKQDQGPLKQEFYFVWDRDELCRVLQAMITVKEGKIERKEKSGTAGGPYHRYFLVICTDEMYLNAVDVDAWLKGATFQASRITDVLLGLSPHPSHQGCPVFPLNLLRRLDGGGAVS